MKMMVCIADYKLVHRNYLWVLFKEFNSMFPKYNIDVYVDLTDQLLIPEMGSYLPPFENINIYETYHDPSIGYDLTFKHREKMIKHQDDYDLFLYTENDILFKEVNIDAFVNESDTLPKMFIPGFVYYERKPKPDNGKYVLTFMKSWHKDGICNGVPGKGNEKRYFINGKSYATVYNACQGSYLLTRKHLKMAIDSGNYLVYPHTHQHDMQPYGVPETAAAAPYTICGMEKIVSLNNLEDFLIPHLRNFYVLQQELEVDCTSDDFFKHHMTLPATIF